MKQLLHRGEKQGFTLIEFSIVLIIIGLVLGGVLIGRDLIDAAEMRQTTYKMESFQSAVNTFKLKYKCVPGDCVNAADMGLGTNGDGDGFLSSFDSLYMMEHLTNAQLIQTNSGQIVWGIDVGFKAIDQSYITTLGPMSVTLGPFAALFYVDFMLITNPDYEDEEFLPGMTSAHARSIDIKMDDGLPMEGKVKAIGVFYDELTYADGEDGYPTIGALGDGTSCLTNATPAQYNNLESTDSLCSLAFKLYY
ncbi:MAG: type II secretion system protein [Rickettsiales bacterium]